LTVSNNKQKQKRKSMNEKFDELAKGLAQSATRRQALKKFGIGLAGLALACFGMASRGAAKGLCRKAGQTCGVDGRGGFHGCCPGLYCNYSRYSSGTCF
jgi:hypothetical protein